MATTGGITVKHHYGRVNRLPGPTGWLTDNGSCTPLATPAPFPDWLVPRTTPISNSQSSDLAEAFDYTLKRDCVRINLKLDAHTVIAQIPA